MFRKSVLIVLLFIFSSSVAFLQKSYFSLSLGGSFPKGAFARAQKIGTDGFAGSSFTMAFDGNYFLGAVGVSGMLNFGMSYLDDQMLKEARIEKLKTLYQQSIIPPDASVDFVSTQWSYVNVMTGPVLSVSVPMVSFEVKALGGVSIVMPPQQNLTVSTGGSTWTSTASGQSLRLGYLTGGAILIHPHPGYGIRLGVDYLATRGIYSVHYNLDQGSLEDNKIDEKESLDVSLVHATVGIFYNF